MLAVTVSTSNVHATSGWVPFLIGLVFGLIIGIYLHRR